MLFLLYLVVRVLARLVVDPRQDDGSKDLEILVLRDELRVLRRKTGPPKLRATDRVPRGGESADPAGPLGLLAS